MSHHIFGFVTAVVEGFNILRIEMGSIYASEFSETAAGWREAVPDEPSQRRQNASGDAVWCRGAQSDGGANCKHHAVPCCGHRRAGRARLHRAIDWQNGLGGKGLSKAIWSNPLPRAGTTSVGSGCSEAPPAWPGCLQGWGSDHLSEQLVPASHHPQCKKFLPYM